MPDIQVSEAILSRLNTLAEHDYHGATLEQTLDHLLREHQEYVMLEAAGELARAYERPKNQ